MKKFNIIFLSFIFISFLSLVSCSKKNNSICEHQNYSFQILNEATCTESGLKQKKCNDCGSNFGEIITIEKLGHTGGHASCKKLAVCSRCNQQYGDYDINEHNFSEYVIITEKDHTVDGKSVRKCSDCGKEEILIDKCEGHQGEWYITKEPGCFVNGQKQRVCTICNEIETVELDPIGHHNLQEATCENGKECSNCHYIEGNGKGHSYGEWQIIKEATCTSTGLKERYCTACNTKQEQIISPINHNYSYDESVEADCTNNGYKHGICTMCGKEVKTTIYSTGHQGEWTVIKEATCTTIGEKQRVCTVCGKTESSNIYSSHNFGEWIVRQDATCKQTGEQYRYCTKCGVEQTSPISKISHQGEWITTIEPTCTTAGKAIMTCTLCNETQYKDLSVLGHRYEGGTCTSPAICVRCNDRREYGHKYVDIGYIVEDPTCHFDGYTLEICSVCGDENKKFIDKILHDFDEGEVLKEATCIDYGRLRKTCKTCGYKMDECELDPSNHKGEFVIDLNPTCVTSGSKHLNCILCNQTIIKEIKELGHDYDDETLCLVNCKRCDYSYKNELGEHLYSENGCVRCNLAYSEFTYTLSDDSSYYIISKYNGYNNSLVFIPKEYNGKPIKKIGANAFQYSKKIKQVIIPSGITNIGNKCFYSCDNLETILIPDSVNYIGDDAFDGCNSLIYNEYENSKYLGNKDNLYLILIKIDKNNEEASINDECKIIYQEALSYFNNLKSIIIPNTITNIGSYAFYNCNNLEEILIPSSVTNIGSYAFEGCNSLVDLYYDGTISDWLNLEIKNGSSLPNYNTNFKNFYKLTSNGTIAFADKSYELLREAIIPATITEISTYAFANVTSLTTIEIPNTIKQVGENAFKGCVNLNSLYYDGKLIDWFDIEFKNDFSLPNYNDNFENFYIKNDVGNIIYNKNNYDILEQVEITQNITKLSSSIFYNCKSLTELIINSDIIEESFYSLYFKNSPIRILTIGENITNISLNAFKGCNNLEEITLPFVGKNMESEGIESVFGYIFGYGNYNEIGTTYQSYAYYYIPKTLKKVTITKTTNIKAVAFNNCSNLKSIEIPTSVTSIGSSAFRNCSSLTSVVIPDSVTFIDENAFKGCNNLEEITLPFVGKSIDSKEHESVFGYIFGYTTTKETGTTNQYNKNSKYYYYYIPSSLTKVILSNNVTNIGNSVFNNCSNLINIVISDNVVSIGANAFDGCNSLIYNEYDNAYYLGNSNNPYLVLVKAKSDDITSCTIYDNCRIIYCEAFKNNVNLNKIVVPNSITSIGNNTFEGCKNLIYASLGDGIEIISNNLFSNCENLKEIVLGNNLQTISSFAFYNCNSLTNIAIPNTVTLIETNAFRECNNLEEITLPFVGKNIDSIGYESVFGYIFGYTTTNETGTTKQYYDGKNYYYYIPSSIKKVTITMDTILTDAFFGCSSLTNIIVPDNVSDVHGAFYECSNLNYNEYDNAYYLGSLNNPYLVLIKAKSTDISSCSINENCKIIYSVAFRSCTNLTSIIIPDSVTSIYSTNFRECSSLKMVKLSSNITEIENYTFYECTSLTSIEIPNGVNRIGTNAFEDCFKLKNIILPSTLVEIDHWAFYDCSSLTSIILPEGIISIGNSAFSNCSSLSSVSILSDVKFESNNVFEKCDNLKTLVLNYKNINSSFNTLFMNKITKLVLLENVESIEAGAFKGYDLLEEITLPFIGKSIYSEKYESVFGYIFGYTTSQVTGTTNQYQYYDGKRNEYYYYYIPSSLTKVTLLNSVKNIGYHAFYNCSNLTNIIILDGVRSIDSYSFYKCSSLTNIEIPTSVTSIGEYAFDGCNSLIYNEYDNAYYLGNSNNPYLILIKAKSTDISSCIINESCKLINSSAFYNCSNLASIEIPDSVTSIGSSAFRNCSSLTSIVIPEGIIGINSYSFYNCSSLTSIVIPEGIIGINSYSFYNCSSLRNIEIPTSVTSIGSSAFRNCSSLTSIVIPGGITSIGDGAFYNCSNLTSIYYNGTLLNWLNITFAYEYNRPNENSSFEYFYMLDDNGNVEYSDKKYSLLTKVVIPEGILEIKGYVFYNFKHITDVTIPTSVTSIGDYAFYGCDSLIYNEYDNAYYLGNPNNPYLILIKAKSTDISSCIINESCKLINSSAFYNCSNLASIEIPDSVTSIGSSAFRNCSSLTSIVIPEGIIGINSYSFYNCSSLRNIEIPTSVTSIGDDAFYNCSSLTNMIIPDSVTYIGYSVFSGCRSLTNIKISTSITSIGSRVFEDCSSLTNIEIPTSVTSIGDYAFSGCSNLKSIEIPTGVTSIQSNAFNNCNNLKIYYKGTYANFTNIKGYYNLEKSNEIYYYCETKPTDEQHSYWHYVNGKPTSW